MAVPNETVHVRLHPWPEVSPLRELQRLRASRVAGSTRLVVCPQQAES